VAGETYTGEALRDALKAGKLTKPRGSVELFGMVKESDDGSSIAFTRAGCDTWVDIPISMIERADHVGHRRCGEHSHPVFRITLKEGESIQARVFGALLASTPERPRVPPQGARPPRRGRFMARQRPPIGPGPGGAGEVNGWSCEQICEEVYAACFRTTEGMPYDDWVALCAFEYDLCMAACSIV
jgi:hypothetical protein